MEGFEEDPAAAFLAREQDELADIAADTLGFTPGPSEVRSLCFYIKVSTYSTLGRFCLYFHELFVHCQILLDLNLYL